MTFTKVAAMAALLGLTQARLFGNKCPETKVVQNFEPARYLGTWYDEYRSHTFDRVEKGECVLAQYSTREDGLIAVDNSQQLYNKDGSISPERSYAKGSAKLEDPDKKEGHLCVKFSIFQPGCGDYQVLDTDYENYTFIYGCSESLLGEITEDFWILSRKPLSHEGKDPELDALTTKANAVFSAQIPNFDF